MFFLFLLEQLVCVYFLSLGKQLFRMYFLSLSKQFSAVQNGVYALGKTHLRPARSLGGFPSVACETVLMLV